MIEARVQRAIAVVAHKGKIVPSGIVCPGARGYDLSVGLNGHGIGIFVVAPIGDHLAVAVEAGIQCPVAVVASEHDVVKRSGQCVPCYDDLAVRLDCQRTCHVLTAHVCDEDSVTIEARVQRAIAVVSHKGKIVPSGIVCPGARGYDLSVGLNGHGIGIFVVAPVGDHLAVAVEAGIRCPVAVVSSERYVINQAIVSVPRNHDLAV